MRLMVVGAHPADAVDLAGGTIAQHLEMGDEIAIVVVTDGLQSHTEGEWTAKDKREEVVSAFTCLGNIKKLFFMGLQDEPFIMNRECIISMVEFIRAFQPQVLMTHHPNEYAHWDHAETGKMVCRALKGAIKRPGGEKWWVENVYFFGVQFRPENARIGVVPQPPNVLIDISPQNIGKKVKAMCCFRSQGHDNEEAMRQRMNSMERETGRADGLDYSEGFISYYPLKDRLLPMSGINKGFYNKEENDG